MLNIVKKFKDIDLVLEFDTIEQLDKDIVKNLLLDDGQIDSAVLSKITRGFKESTSNFLQPEDMARMIAKGVRLVVFLNQNMYVNLEVKGEEALSILKD